MALRMTRAATTSIRLLRRSRVTEGSPQRTLDERRTQYRRILASRRILNRRRYTLHHHRSHIALTAAPAQPFLLRWRHN
ncbi:hypothetical protein CspeluHIS016_0105910 [Cutaneotrichosporon spelunceum]|uniref:Uncharacterized protein n=1 Tax=Cutaneotrichosporon spelunceum TaxID=1672016 RepID=A0AAD3Y833_9TREE|nr:hypothetical protein CspeluHIS016_0105910 [Cutaneotrichosporon spelunceum]